MNKRTVHGIDLRGRCLKEVQRGTRRIPAIAAVAKL
jgi:hypothetical protein